MGTSMIMYDEEYQQIKAILARLHTDTHAKLVFLVDKNGIPSNGEWIRLDKKPAERPKPHEVTHPKEHGPAHDHNPGFPIPGFPRKSDRKGKADAD